MNCPVLNDKDKWRVKVDCTRGRNSRCSNVHKLRKNDPDVRNSKRCESSTKDMHNADIKPRRSYFYGFSIFIPKKWENDVQSEILFQWKGLKGGKPFMSVHSKDTIFYIVIDTSPNPNFHAKEDNPRLLKRNHTITENFAVGKWHDFLFNVTWEFNLADNSGVAQLFVDYKTEDDDEYTTVVEDDQPNMYNVYGYAKWGIYKPGWKTNPNASTVTKRKVWHDNVRIGYTREIVDPSIPR